MGMLKIGNLELRYRAMPAPLASITDIVFRKLLDEIGYIDYMVTEMISAEGLRRMQKKTLDMIRPADFKTPQFIQLFGSEPAPFVDAVKYIENETVFRGIDLNMGCPAGKVIRRGGGSALMKDPLKVAAIVREIRKNTVLPLTVKLRLGFNQDSVFEIAKAAEDEGADAIAVHFRLRSDGYSGDAKWDYAPLIKEKLRVSTVFIGNGDVKTSTDAVEKLGAVDAVMIGRGSVVNPFIFAEVAGVNPDSMDIHGVYSRIIDLIEAYYPAKLHLPRLKAYARYLFSNRPNCKRIRQQIYSFHDFEDAKRLLKEECALCDSPDSEPEI